jgi:uncharacterized membrane protein YedE/YeeE
MKLLKYLFIGILFGIVMTKSEAISWYRIQEMFRFQSFHMYGIIMTATGLGMVLLFFMKKYNFKTLEGGSLREKVLQKGTLRYLFGGIVFGLGWALSGACPGPMYTLIGSGITVFIPIIASAVLGTLVYGMVKKYLPH